MTIYVITETRIQFKAYCLNRRISEHNRLYVNLMTINPRTSEHLRGFKFNSNDEVLESDDLMSAGLRRLLGTDRVEFYGTPENGKFLHDVLFTLRLRGWKDGRIFMR